MDKGKRIGRRIRETVKTEDPFDFAGAGRWTLRFVFIGLIAGMASIVFQYLCHLGFYLFMDFLAGHRPPSSAGEGVLFSPTSALFNRWTLLFLPALGGLISGVLVYTFAPEAEGAGIDAALDAYHRRGGTIRARVPLVKMLASTITLTTGGSGGREGPIAHIGAGLGSFLASCLKMSDRERRIMMAAGLGAGVGSIFRAPMAGALFAAEVLYRDPELESEVIIPAGVSSAVAYCTFCLVFGWGSLFESPDFRFANALELGPYLVLALVLVATGAFFIKCFHGVTKIFKSLRIPRFAKPFIGGLCTGGIGFFLPQTLSIGYGYAQKALYSELTIPFLLQLALGKVLTTSFSIGSGGSGGVFGPSVVIGGAMGGVVGLLFHEMMPEVVSHPGSFVVVGMAGFFTAVSNTPVSTIIFVSEMTNSYHLLLPNLLVCSVSYLAGRRWNIFKKQVKGRMDSPAHAGEFFVDILQAIRVKDLMHLIKKVDLIRADMTFLDFKKYFSQTKQHYFPVMGENGKLIGIFSSTDIRGVLFSQEIEHLVVMKDICTSDIIVTTLSEDLNVVLQKFTVKNIDSLPVVSEKDPGILIGMLNRREVIAFYNQRVGEMKKSAG